EVEKDQVWPFVSRLIDRRDGVAGEHGVVALGLQPHSEQTPDVLVVIDDEDLLAGHRQYWPSEPDRRPYASALSKRKTASGIPTALKMARKSASPCHWRSKSVARTPSKAGRIGEIRLTTSSQPGSTETGKAAPLTRLREK